MDSSIDDGQAVFRCLVVDDSAFARQNISGIVNKAGGDVVGQARNGIEALELFGKLNPDLVLLDITMPELDGIETLRKIMEEDRNAKVVIMSSVGHKEMIWKALTLGAKHFVTKPYDPGYAGMIIKSVVQGTNGGA